MLQFLIDFVKSVADKSYIYNEADNNQLTQLQSMIESNNGRNQREKVVKKISWNFSDSENENQGANITSDKYYHLKSSPSTIDSPTISPLSYGSRVDKIDISDFQYCEKCPDYHGKGYCIEGNDCTMIHEQKTYNEILTKKSLSSQNNLIQNFPELLLLSTKRRINSFLI